MVMTMTNTRGYFIPCAHTLKYRMKATTVESAKARETKRERER